MPSFAFAAPVISGVSGAIANGSQITISGSGFGTKTQASPLKWDNFDAGIEGSSLSGWTFSNEPYNPIFSSLQAHSGLQSAFLDFTAPVYNRGFYVNNTDASQVYMNFWYRWSSTGASTRQFKIWDWNGWDPCIETFAGETYFVGNGW
jgi:hypothetical protein